MTQARYTKEGLAKLHTGTLLRMFESQRALLDRASRDDGCDLDDYAYLRLLKDELDGREHVPNKLEAKEARRQKAKDKKSRGRQD